jgi:hypothetical protein
MTRLDWLLESVPLAFTPQRIQFLRGWTSDHTTDDTAPRFVPDVNVPRADVNAAMSVPPMTPPPPRPTRSVMMTMTAQEESVFHLPRVVVTGGCAPSSSQRPVAPPPPVASSSTTQLDNIMEDVAPASASAVHATQEESTTHQSLSKVERELCVSTIRTWLTTHLQEMRKQIPPSAGHLIDKLEIAMIARLNQKTDVEIRDTSQLEQELQKDLNEEIARLSTKKKPRARKSSSEADTAAAQATTPATTSRGSSSKKKKQPSSSK